MTALASRTAVVVAAVATAMCAGAPPAAAAPADRPNASASCVGQVFVPQATGAPRTISLRIHEIMDTLLLPGQSFGDPIHGLARDTWCR